CRDHHALDRCDVTNRIPHRKRRSDGPMCRELRREVLDREARIDDAKRSTECEKTLHVETIGEESVDETARRFEYLLACGKTRARKKPRLESRSRRVAAVRR